MAIKIPFLADVTKFLAGTKDVETSLDDIADSLDDITTAGADVDQTVGRELTDLADTADDSADKIRRSFKEAFRAVEDQGRTSSRKVRNDVDDVGDKGKASLREFSSEAKQNVAETVSSFNGSASSAVDAIQGTFGGLVSALGPAGLLGAAAAAAGIGLARGLFEKSKAAAAEVAEAVADITGQLIDLGSFSLGTEQVDEKLKEMASTAEDGKNALAEISDAATDAGINFRDYARGLAGDTEAIQRSYTEVTDKIAGMDKAQQDLMHTTGVTQEQVDRLTASQLEQRDALEKARDALVAQDGTLDEATRTALLYKDATDKQKTATKGASDQILEMVDHLGLIPPEKHTDVKVDDHGSAKETSNAVDDAARDRSTTVKVSADMSGVDHQIRNYFNGRTFDFRVYARPGMKVAE